MCAASSWALKKTLTVRLLTASPLKWLEIFTVASKRLKLLLTLSFDEYVGGYLNFSLKTVVQILLQEWEWVPF